jgi:hypothetical protein
MNSKPQKPKNKIKIKRNKVSINNLRKKYFSKKYWLNNKMRIKYNKLYSGKSQKCKNLLLVEDEN